MSGTFDRTARRLDEDLARFGDLEAQKRVLQRQEIAMLRRRNQQLEQAEFAAQTPAAAPTAPALRGQKGAELQGERALIPLKKRGPRTGKREAATQRMIADIRAGKHTLDDLVAMGQKVLAAEYDVKSRDTASKALAHASEIVGIPNSGK